MPVRVLVLLLGEQDRLNTERQRSIDRMTRGEKLSGYMAIPPFFED